MVSYVYATTHCLSSTIMVAVVYPVALTSKIDTSPDGVPLCARRGLIDTARKNHSQSRQELVRSPGVHAVHSSTLFVAEMALDGGGSPRDRLVLADMSRGLLPNLRATIVVLSAGSSVIKNAQLKSSR